MVKEVSRITVSASIEYTECIVSCYLVPGGCGTST